MIRAHPRKSASRFIRLWSASPNSRKSSSGRVRPRPEASPPAPGPRGAHCVPQERTPWSAMVWGLDPDRKMALSATRGSTRDPKSAIAAPCRNFPRGPDRRAADTPRPRRSWASRLPNSWKVPACARIPALPPAKARPEGAHRRAGSRARIASGEAPGMPGETTWASARPSPARMSPARRRSAMDR